MPTALRNYLAIYSLKRSNYFPDIYLRSFIDLIMQLLCLIDNAAVYAMLSQIHELATEVQ